jgi:hypothetical protein
MATTVSQSECACHRQGMLTLGTESRLFSTCSTLSSDSEGLKDYALGRGRDWVQRNGQLQHRAGGLPGEEPKEVLRLGLDDWDEERMRGEAKRVGIVVVG